VQGVNPRTVNVPGSAAFEVVCEQLQTCPVAAPETSIMQTIGLQWPEWSAYEAKIDIATWGHVAGHGSATSQPESEPEGALSPVVTIELGWRDFIALMPVNASQEGQLVLLLAEVSSSLTVDGSNPEDSEADAHFNIGTHCVDDCDPYDGSHTEIRFRRDGPGTVTKTEVLGFVGRLGQWLEFESYLAINIGPNSDGSSSSASASLRIDRLVGVVDLDTRETVATREICTASGATY
jgi:hypothetical protein